MRIEIDNEYEPFVVQTAKACGFDDVQQYVNMLIHQAVELRAIKEGLASADAGRVKSLEQFDKDFRQRNSIPAS